MVFKPFSYLARQNFTKAFTHGYAQSVVAASQSSYASSTTSLNQLASHPGKFTRTAQLQGAFQNPSSSGAGAKAGHTNTAFGDAGLAAYYAAWQHAQQTGDDSDWRQFQFKKRIGWRPSKEGATDESKDEGSRLASNSLSVGDVEGFEEATTHEEVNAKVEEAVAREIRIQQEEAKAEDLAGSKDTFDVNAPQPSTPDAANIDDATAEKSRASSDQIVQLASTKKYVEIPAAFETLLKEGLTPTVEAYNALLSAAITLHVDSSHAVSKTLGVYSDMLRRGVTPNEDTYATLVAALVSRALETLGARESLEQQRIRFGGVEEPGKFMFRSNEAEYDLLTEDNSLVIAIKLFNAATTRHTQLVFPLEVYRALVTACADEGKIEDMVRIYTHMEKQKVTPHAAIFPSMIDALAAIGDLKSAVECYNEYRALAIADDAGVFGIVERRDAEVYAAVVRAYLSCGKEEGALRFLDRIRESFNEVRDDREARLDAIEAVVIRDALVQHLLNAGQFAKAIEQAESMLRHDELYAAMAKICIAAADAGDVPVASVAYDRLSTGTTSVLAPAVSMLALHLREGNVSAVRPFWVALAEADRATPDFIQPTTMYAVALLMSGRVDEGLMEARKMFSLIRNTAADQQLLQGPIHEEIDEALELLGRVTIRSGGVVSPQALMTLIRSMVENGGLVSPVAENSIARLGPAEISCLSIDDLTLALRVQAGMVANDAMPFDDNNLIRLAHMIEIAFSAKLPLSSTTIHLVDQAIGKISDRKPDLVRKWQDFFARVGKQSYGQGPFTSVSESSTATPSLSDDSFDPYAHATDYRGSAVIADELEKSGRAESRLSEALMKFKNMRRLGRHPRYITYAKLITAAARCNRMDLVRDIFGMAKSDVPLLSQYSAVKYGWVSILDAMVAACLNLGDRSLASKYHEELSGIGAAPSANTFGLYITTLKESTRTFDEATEAVKIFQRAKAEGVEPTSFLYNALIGKLAKARRIDDCLLYFAEMRGSGVRPTSVTYGTIVNALCRVSDEHFAEEMFDEMESMPNYKPRAAPYNSMIQYFLNTKRDRSKVLAYYERMQSRHIEPSMHTYKLLIDAYASLEPVDMNSAEKILKTIKATGHRPEATHYASLIHAKGCALHDMAGARKTFDSVISTSDEFMQPCLYQALFEAMVANHRVTDTTAVLKDMEKHGVQMTAYIANTLIHGWAAEDDISKARAIYDRIGIEKREPSTYEVMTRAFLAARDRRNAVLVVQEMLSRGYPTAVAAKILELINSPTTPTNGAP